MAQFHDSDWWSSELKRMLEEQQPEDLHLDYKDKRSLLPPGKGGGGIDRQKRANDVSKDVSSFLNSDGGVLIYGVPETDDPNTTGGAPIPLNSLDSNKIGFERGEITKETIENLITSNIQPKPGPEVFQIVEVKLDGRIFFIVEVVVGVGDVWQAKDKKYYKRFHYKAEAMDHYEINMVRDRDVATNLKLVLGLDEYWGKEKRKQGADDKNTIYIGVQNDTNSVVEAALVELGIYGFGRFGWASSGRVGEESRLLSPFRRVGYRGIESDWRGVTTDWYDLSWPVDGLYRPIFKTVEPIFISKFEFMTVESPDNTVGQLFWRIQAPGMNQRKGRVYIPNNWRRRSISVEEGDGDFEILDEA